MSTKRPPAAGTGDGAYAMAGVDTGAADRAIGALVGVLRTIDTGRASRTVPLPGHYAAVLEVAPNLGIAVGTDGVGSKLIVAELTGRYDTIGIDCIAMNVNDVICVGAEPIAVLDYLAVEQTDPDVFEAIARGLKAGAEQAGVEIPGGEVAVLPELIRGHPSPGGFDLTAACFGTVALDRIVTGADCAPGDALIGLPSSGLHSNGYTLARRVLEPLGLDHRPDALGGPSVADALLEPTVIYVRAVLDLLRSDLPVHGLAHITGGGLRTCCGSRTASASRSRRRCRCRRCSTSCASTARSPRPSCGASSTWAAASSSSCRRRWPRRPSRCSRRTTPARPGSARVTGAAGRVGVPPLGVALSA